MQSNLRIVSGSRNKPPTLLDWSIVEGALSEFGSENDSRKHRFQLFILHELFGLDAPAADECITDGGDDRGIDAIFIDREQKKIHLLQTKSVDEFQSCHKNFPGREVDKIITFIEHLLNQRKNLTKSCNPILAVKIREIWDLLNETYHETTVHLCSNQAGLIPRERERLNSYLTAHRLTLKESHLVELARGIPQTTTPPERKLIRFVEDKRYEQSHGNIRSLTGTVKAIEFCQFLADEIGVAIDSMLFHSNVRYVLGIQNPVSREISRTLACGDAHEFWYLNNGVTMVCDQLIHQVGSQFPVELTRPQIVNGCQTAHALFEAFKQIPERLADVTLSVRVIETRDPDLVERIAISTNRQSRVGTRDLRANDDVQLKLAAGLRREGYFYRRKRGQHGDIASDQVIDILRAGQLMLAYYLGQPEKSKTATNAIFGDLYDRVFDPEFISPQTIVTAHKLFRIIENRKSMAIAKMRSLARDKYGEAWIVEGAYHVLYVVKLLCDRDQINFVQFEEAKRRIDEAIRVVGDFFQKQDGAAAYRIFRSASTKDALGETVWTRKANVYAKTEPQLKLEL